MERQIRGDLDNEQPLKLARKRWLTILAAVLVLAGATTWLARDWLTGQVYLRVLEWDGRVEGLQVDRVVEALHLTPGMRVADIGAGTGLFSWPRARPTPLLSACRGDPHATSAARA